ncbi:MAG: acetylornithine carbamoyltransferase [Proteobacteria bacterium]|nr:acetylornithine carbamoyltransferase [Pseudomonadota bacterium]
MRNFISVQDVKDVDALIAKGLEYKKNPKLDETLGRGKRAGLVFFNPSLRTRLSTQLAAKNLGLEPIVLNAGSEGWSLEFQDGAVMNGQTVEHIKDAAPILGAYFDLLCVRSFPKFQDRAEDESDHVIRSFIKYSGVPVVSLESATRHPLQSLADLITMTETFTEKRRPRVVLTWAPHIKAIPHCVANSFAEWVRAWGKADFVYTAPKGYELSGEYVEGVPYTDQQTRALEGADFVYVKNWSSVTEYGKVLGEHPGWMLTEKSLSAAPHAKVMHCLPLRRNVELSDEILDGPRNLLTRMAMNRVWSAQSVLGTILKELK